MATGVRRCAGRRRGKVTPAGIACVNVVNLVLARGMARRRELATRMALGAGRVRLVRLLNVEHTLLAVWVSGRAALGPGRLARESHHPRRVARSLVVAEIAASLVLVIGSGLFIRSFANMLAVEPGFSTDRALTLQLAVPGIVRSGVPPRVLSAGRQRHGETPRGGRGRPGVGAAAGAAIQRRVLPRRRSATRVRRSAGDRQLPARDARLLPGHGDSAAPRPAPDLE